MIKKGMIFLGAVSMVFFTSCKDKAEAVKKVKTDNVAQAAQRDAVAKNFAAMTFDKTVHDFGNIQEGDKVETVFKFTNTGSSPLLITNIKGSCGCTVPNDWPKQPIAPGAEGQFTVKYNSANKPGTKTVQVAVTANTEKGKEVVSIKANAAVNPEMEARRQQAKVAREARMKEQQAKQAAAKKATAVKDGHEGHNH